MIIHDQANIDIVPKRILRSIALMATIIALWLVLIFIETMVAIGRQVTPQGLQFMLYFPTCRAALGVATIYLVRRFFRPNGSYSVYYSAVVFYVLTFCLLVLLMFQVVGVLDATKSTPMRTGWWALLGSASDGIIDRFGWSGVPGFGAAWMLAAPFVSKMRSASRLILLVFAVLLATCGLFGLPSIYKLGDRSPFDSIYELAFTRLLILIQVVWGIGFIWTMRIDYESLRRALGTTHCMRCWFQCGELDRCPECGLPR